MRPAGLALASALLTVMIGACAGERAPAGGARPPRTAAERARAEPQPDEGDKVSAEGKKWGGWRYQGSRDECFFVVKRKCYDKQAAACAAARCGDKRCVVEGGGPATVRCK